MSPPSISGRGSLAMPSQPCTLSPGPHTCAPQGSRVSAAKVREAPLPRCSLLPRGRWRRVAHGLVRGWGAWAFAVAKRLAHSQDVVADSCGLCAQRKHGPQRGSEAESGEESEEEAEEEAGGREAPPSTSSASARPGKGKKRQGVGDKSQKKKVSRHPQPYTLHHLSLLWHHHPWGLPNP